MGKMLNNLGNIIKSEEKPFIAKICNKVISDIRITSDEAISLYKSASLPLLSYLATIIRERKNGKNVYFIRNIHIEPTNICYYNCKFCSYSQTSKEKQWDYTISEIIEKVKNIPEEIREIHITGGAHPDKSLNFYLTLANEIKAAHPEIHLKAYSAVELDYVFKKEGLTYDEGIKRIKSAGVDSIPGGGAEIFDKNIRKEICPEKISSEEWLEMHKTAHKNGLTSNATMLYGHKESYEHRIEHLNHLRTIQDETSGFNCFIPLKFRNANNKMSGLKETSLVEDLKNFAVSRIFLDNFPHIKAYWPATTIDAAILSMSFGADDIDGTINNSTSIYSSAGAENKNPSISADELKFLISNAGFTPIERDSLYKPI